MVPVAAERWQEWQHQIRYCRIGSCMRVERKPGTTADLLIGTTRTKSGTFGHEVTLEDLEAIDCSLSHTGPGCEDQQQTQNKVKHQPP